MSTGSLPHAFDMAEPIPGYRMQQRIGVGGYGEVWKAEAPGGIAKAIKVVYGFYDDERASRELAALNRIKEVRHPFLLSLERIELVEGRLLIVSELASSSLKNFFEECRALGLSGIPRDELLAHLRDAADALDYICQEHSLQHLDVKPENLLLMGGRIKVADFGLVKDLQDTCSIVGGMTPLYAAPELFTAISTAWPSSINRCSPAKCRTRGAARRSLPPSTCTAVRGSIRCPAGISPRSPKPCRRTPSSASPRAARWSTACWRRRSASVLRRCGPARHGPAAAMRCRRRPRCSRGGCCLRERRSPARRCTR
jgi:serine/threonine protein kinase